jgi:hypothetical protein
LTPKPRRQLDDDDDDDDDDARWRDEPLQIPGDSTGRAAATVDATARGLRQVQLNSNIMVVAMVQCRKIIDPNEENESNENQSV